MCQKGSRRLGELETRHMPANRAPAIPSGSAPEAQLEGGGGGKVDVVPSSGPAIIAIATIATEGAEAVRDVTAGATGLVGDALRSGDGGQRRLDTTDAVSVPAGGGPSSSSDKTMAGEGVIDVEVVTTVPAVAPVKATTPAELERARQAEEKARIEQGKREAAARRAAVAAAAKGARPFDGPSRTPARRPVVETRRPSSPGVPQARPGTTPISTAGRPSGTPEAQRRAPAEISDRVRQETRGKILEVLRDPRNQQTPSPVAQGIVSSKIRHPLNSLRPGQSRLVAENADTLRGFDRAEISAYVAETYAALQEVFAEDPEVLSAIPAWMKGPAGVDRRR
jgi:hypothetical protein